jgi:hypothetical protein
VHAHEAGQVGQPLRDPELTLDRGIDPAVDPAGALNRRVLIQFSHAFPGAKPTLGKTGISTQVRLWNRARTAISGVGVAKSHNIWGCEGREFNV